MAKLHLYAASVTASLTILLTAAAAQDAALLKQAQELFQPLPKNMATPESPTTREGVLLGRSLFFDPRLTIDGNIELLELPSAGALWNGRAASIDRRAATPSSTARPDGRQRGPEHHSLARRSRQRRRPGGKGPDFADHLRPTGREGRDRAGERHHGLCRAVQRQHSQTTRNR